MYKKFLVVSFSLFCHTVSVAKKPKVVPSLSLSTLMPPSDKKLSPRKKSAGKTESSFVVVKLGPDILAAIMASDVANDTAKK